MFVDDEDDFKLTAIEEVEPKEVCRNAYDLVVRYIDKFFSDKMFHCGGTIPKRLLHDPRRISMVMNFNIIKGVDKAYEAFEDIIPAAEIEEAKRTGNITDDVKIVNETLKLLAKSKVPQQFAGGMMLMYLEFVEGVRIES